MHGPEASEYQVTSFGCTRTSRRRAGVALALVLVGVALPAASAAQTSTPPASLAASVAIIEASPNPVSVGPGLGSTTITWTTGDGSVGLVYVSTNGGVYTLFAEGSSGSAAANWIGGGATYEFRLYTAVTPPALLASVQVRTTAEAVTRRAFLLLTLVGVAISLLGAAALLARRYRTSASSGSQNLELRQVLSWRQITLLGALGFIAGLVAKYFMLFHMGNPDMSAYIGWGSAALESGLPSQYKGIYFPLQYQILEGCAWIAARTGVAIIPILKLSNLVFDIGTFCLLLLLLRRRGSNPSAAWLYWLHPWFLSMFAMGYIDFQFSFFVVLSIYCLTGDTARKYLLAGIPLGCAFVMKPQAQVLLIATAAYGAFHYARTRDWRPLGMLVCSVVLFLGYEAFFTVSLFPTLGYEAAYVLPSNYLNVSNVMPSLTAQMPNFWYPVAYFIRPDGVGTYAVSDQLQLLPHLTVKYAAAAVVLGLIAFHVFRTEKDLTMTVADRFAAIFGLASLTVPFIMTSAHENHLFLGSVFLVLFLGTRRQPSFRLASHILLMVQFLNTYGLYGIWPGGVGQVLTFYSQELSLVYALISVPCFLLILYRLAVQARDVPVAVEM